MQKEVDFQFSARYHQLGEIGSATKEVWFVLHGQGQLAKFFIKKFESIQSVERCIIAPEGLNRYYLEGFSGRVGAGWMTKEDRLRDISNYLNYLDSVYNSAIPKSSRLAVTFLGFSQGAATVSRWAEVNQGFDRLVLWAGMFPPDMNFNYSAKALAKKEVWQVVGSEDPYINQQNLQEQEWSVKRLGINPKTIEFKGGHDIDQMALLQLVNRA